MSLENLIKYASINEVIIGSDISQINVHFDVITSQDGDIPGICNFDFLGNYIEIFIKDNKVIKIRFDLEYEENNVNLITMNGNNYELSTSSTFNEVLSILKKEKFTVVIVSDEPSNHFIQLINGVTFQFGDYEDQILLCSVFVGG